MNTDVSGIGVRISFYLQILFLACLSARSGSLDEITTSLYTLIATNMAMAVTALILGWKPNPEISFHDALVVFYLLFMSWFTVVFSLPSCRRFRTGTRILNFLSIVQSYAVFAFVFTMLIRARTFGSIPECNGHAVVVLFRPFPALNAGRIVGWIVIIIFVVIYTIVTFMDYLPPPPKHVQEWIRKKRVWRRRRRTAPTVQGAPNNMGSGANTYEIPQDNLIPYNQPYSKQQSRYDLQIAWDLIIEITAVIILWALAVMNTELLIRWNHFERPSSPQSAWQFGQVLPMFLVVLPAINMINAFKEFGLKPWQRSTSTQSQPAQWVKQGGMGAWIRQNPALGA